MFSSTVLQADVELISGPDKDKVCNTIVLDNQLKYRSNPVLTKLDKGDNPTVFRQNEINKLYIKVKLHYIQLL